MQAEHDERRCWRHKRDLVDMLLSAVKSRNVALVELALSKGAAITCDSFWVSKIAGPAKLVVVCLHYSPSHMPF